MKKIITIGSATQDIFIEYENPQAKTLGDSTLDMCSYLLVAEGCKIEVQDIYYATGGGGTNSAVSFSRLGFEVTSFFQIGDDSTGIYVMEELAKQKITLKSITSPEHKTGRSFILPSPTGNRPILAYRGVNAFLTPDKLPLDELSNYELVYITSLSGHSSQCLLPLAKKAREHGCLVATNPGKSQFSAGAETLREALPYVSILLLNAHEASQLMYSFKEISAALSSAHIFAKDTPNLLAQPMRYKEYSFNLKDFFKTVHKHGPNMVVVTNGAEGVYLSDQKNIYFQASMPTQVASTVGAGDAFGSCFVASILQNIAIEQALANGIINAISVISYMDAKTGLLTKDQLHQFGKTLPPLKLFEL